MSDTINVDDNATYTMHRHAPNRGEVETSEQVDAAHVHRFLNAAPFFNGLVDTPETHTQDDDGTITPGAWNNQDWIVENGLKPGERVIVEGLTKVQPGIVVVPTPYAAPQSEPAKAQ